MNEQQIQQILTIQQAIAAAATAAVINSLFNPQQAAANALTATIADQSTSATATTPTNLDGAHLQQQTHHLQQADSPTMASSPTNNQQQAECNSRIQELLMQLQQQAAAAGNGPNDLSAALNLNMGAQAGNLSGAISGSNRSPLGRLSAQELQTAAAVAAAAAAAAAATSSNNSTQQQQSNHPSAAQSPMKKLKRHHNQQLHTNQHHHQHHRQQQPQQPYHNRSSEATSKPHNSSAPKNHHSAISSLNSSRNSQTGGGNNNNSSSSSSSAFIANNVGLPRKLVRGQDVWLGRGAEQTRQILKCMWCGQSFRTLAEMTQHMKITQHYTNIISQEQITSWRQPETVSEPNSKHGKQSTQLRGLDDDSSDKFNDSDREDIFSNDGDLEQQKQRSNSQNRLDQSKNDSADISAPESNHGDSPKALKSSPSSKPLTRSRRRENETSPTKKRDSVGRENSPATSSSSQQRQNSASISSSSSNNNLILGDLNEESEANKEESETNCSSPTPDSKVKVEEEVKNADGEDLSAQGDSEDEQKRGEKRKSISDNERLLKEITNDEADTGGDAEDMINEDDVEDELADGDNDEDEKKSETSESVAGDLTAATCGTKTGVKGETGDPLSALETMVEKSFDPRLRPGVANGGILQRLGIDEEVCPPWQHINYANWYAAAAYGHPMAAALLAAGINLQNGIKLSKNTGPKKNED